MAQHVLTAALRHLAGLARRPAADDTDAALVAAVAADRNEAAFPELLRRHGPLVWGVCRRAAGHQQDAEDAFQATWLVLARKAGAIGRRESVASWLYGVAFRTARCARARAD